MDTLDYILNGKMDLSPLKNREGGLKKTRKPTTFERVLPDLTAIGAACLVVYTASKPFFAPAYGVLLSGAALVFMMGQKAKIVKERLNEQVLRELCTDKRFQDDPLLTSFYSSQPTPRRREAGFYQHARLLRDAAIRP